jgi:hypothetical protein
MGSTREQAHHASVVSRYGLDIASYAATVIETAKAAEAARKPSVNQAAGVPVRASVRPNRWGAVAVDTNGNRVDTHHRTVTPAMLLGRRRTK